MLPSDKPGEWKMFPYTTRNSKYVGAMRMSLAAMIAFFAILALNAHQAKANDLIVRYDQSQILRLPRPVSELIIGNPSIADVAIQGSDLLDQRVIVQRDEQRLVNLHKGAMRQSYTCSPNCQPTITIGDDPTYFEQIAKHSSTKTRFSDSGAETTPGGGQ
jgi:hypothetical protein